MKECKKEQKILRMEVSLVENQDPSFFCRLEDKRAMPATKCTKNELQTFHDA